MNIMYNQESHGKVQIGKPFALKGFQKKALNVRINRW